MLDKLKSIEEKYLELERFLNDPDAMSDMKQWQKNRKEHAKLTDIVEKFREWQKIEKELLDNQQLLKEETEKEFKDMVENEINSLLENKKQIMEELQVLLLPRDPNDDKGVIMEIRGGAGGDEAALFAGDLFRAYMRYADSMGWKTELLDGNATGLGGFKEVVFAIDGDGVFSNLKFESGVHRVQRVPETESSGRIHTSTVTVAVLPEAEEVEVEINVNDLKIDTYCASGAGGQHVNKTESAVRITHTPTGIVVQCQDEKSQLKNRERALRVLRAKLLEKAEAEQHSEMAEERKSQVGTGDRSERIRTYNFPQGRVTDHRIGLTLHKLDFVMNGDFQELIDALRTADQAQRLAVRAE